MADYGEVEVTRHDDGRLEVVRADRTIGIAVGLLAEAAGEGLTVDASGRLVIAGQVRYTPIRFADHGRIVVCERSD